MGRALHHLKTDATHVPGPIHDVADDLSFECHTDLPAAIPEGNYSVSFIRAERKFLWSRQKVFLHFLVQELGAFNGTRLFMACNVPTKGRLALSSKYWRMWCLAAGRRPTRADRLSTSVFRNKIFRARVRTVITTYKQSDRPAEARYSIVDELLEKETGQ